MKATLTLHGITVAVEASAEDLTIYQCLEVMRMLLCGHGYSEETVNEQLPINECQDSLADLVLKSK